MKPLKHILLIDDDDIINFIHKRLLDSMDLADKISIVNDGKEALEFLSTRDERGVFVNPELIFLDVSMPGMGGFEFLDEYQKFDAIRKEKHAVLMLSTSENQKDTARALAYKEIRAYIHKPLTDSLVTEIVGTYCHASRSDAGQPHRKLY